MTAHAREPQPSHVFGTIHSVDPRVLDLDPAIERASRAARHYTFELDFDADIRQNMRRRRSRNSSARPPGDAPGAWLRGALNLPGERGLLRLLEEAGYTVTPVE